jgi:cobalamin biosynthesis protein CbiG
MNTGRKIPVRETNPDRISYFSLTEGGALLALRLRDRFGGTAHLPRCQSLGCGHCSPFDSIAEALPQRFLAGDTIVCVMAAGIVIRLLAPHLKDKHTEPAVVVIDEEGRHAIPLLGGHAAGANNLATEIAAYLGGHAAVTTSSDAQGLVSVDEVARLVDARIEDAAAARSLTAALVNGASLCIESDADPGIPGYAWLRPGGDPGAYEGRLRIDYHRQTEVSDHAVASKASSCRESAWSARGMTNGQISTLRLVPRVVCAGVGCRRGAGAEQIISALQCACEAARVEPGAVGTLASIDIKHDEAGLVAAAEGLGARLVFFGAGELEALQRSGSDFVRQAVGAGAVAEPAALLAAGPGAGLLLAKRAYGGVTVSLAVKGSPFLTNLHESDMNG